MPRVLRLHQFIGPEGLKIDEIPLAEPKGNEVRFQVKAFSLNYGDFELMENAYVFDIQLPCRMGDEASGVVDAVGPDVTKFKPGDRVSSIPWMNEGYGVNGEFAIVPETFVAKYPENLSAEQACCIWVAFLTAYYAFMEISKITEDDFALITAASSSAGLAANEIAKTVGATTIGTTRNERSRAFLLEKGVDYVINTSTENISERVQEYTRGMGARVIYDPVGGPLVQDYAGTLAQKADIYLYGGMDGRPTILPEIEMTQKAAVLRPYSVYHHVYDPEQLDRGIKFVSKGLKEGRLKPSIDQIFLFDNFKKAFEYSKSGKSRTGKIVVTI